MPGLGPYGACRDIKRREREGEDRQIETGGIYTVTRVSTDARHELNHENLEHSMHSLLQVGVAVRLTLGLTEGLTWGLGNQQIARVARDGFDSCVKCAAPGLQGNLDVASVTGRRYLEHGKPPLTYFHEGICTRFVNVSCAPQNDEKPSTGDHDRRVNTHALPLKAS